MWEQREYKPLSPLDITQNERIMFLDRRPLKEVSTNFSLTVCLMGRCKEMIEIFHKRIDFCWAWKWKESFVDWSSFVEEVKFAFFQSEWRSAFLWIRYEIKNSFLWTRFESWFKHQESFQYFCEVNGEAESIVSSLNLISLDSIRLQIEIFEKFKQSNLSKYISKLRREINE